MKNDEYKHYNCRRCGACCIYFAVMNEGGIAEIEPIFKREEEACKYLEYDKETRQASCRIHDKKRPSACNYFFCGSPDCSDKETKANLARVSENIEEYIKARDKPRTLEQIFKNLRTS
jgi:hypothetical protein